MAHEAGALRYTYMGHERSNDTAQRRTHAKVFRKNKGCDSYVCVPALSHQLAYPDVHRQPVIRPRFYPELKKRIAISVATLPSYISRW